MKKVLALLTLSLALIHFSRWAGEHGLDYWLSGFPPEKHTLMLEVTVMPELLLLAEHGSLGLAGVLLVCSAAVYFHERAAR